MGSRKSVVIRFAGHAGLAALFIVAALLGIFSGVMFAYAGDLAGILGRLPLRVVEIRRNGDDSLLDLLAEMSLGGLLHLL